MDTGVLAFLISCISTALVVIILEVIKSGRGPKNNNPEGPVSIGV